VADYDRSEAVWLCCKSKTGRESNASRPVLFPNGTFTVGNENSRGTRDTSAPIADEAIGLSSRKSARPEVDIYDDRCLAP
jgi:hypothetical protein